MKWNLPGEFDFEEKNNEYDWGGHDGSDGRPPVEIRSLAVIVTERRDEPASLHRWLKTIWNV